MTTKQYDAYSDLITFTRASTGTALRHVGYGAELTPDPSFDDPTATNDEAVAGYDVVGGELVVVSAPAFHSGVGQSLTQSLVVGKVYQVSYTITEYTSGTIRAQLIGGGANINLTARSAAGTYEQIIVASHAHAFFFVPVYCGWHNA